MSEIDQLLALNFVDALKDLQRYLVLGLGSAVSALAIAIRRPSRNKDESQLNSLPVPMEPDIAMVMALTLCGVLGILAFFAAESACGIADRYDRPRRF